MTMLTQNRSVTRLLQLLLLPIGVAALSALLQAWDPQQLVLRYQRDLIGDFQLWRLLSGHFVHLGWTHWLMNMLGLLLIWLLFESTFKTWLAAVYLLICSVLISFLLYTCSQNVAWYVGLSGALHGLFVLGMLSQFRRQPLFAAVVLAFFAAKLIWEQLYGPLPGSEETAGGSVVVVAHTYGALVGAGLFGLVSVVRKLKNNHVRHEGH